MISNKWLELDVRRHDGVLMDSTKINNAECEALWSRLRVNGDSWRGAAQTIRIPVNTLIWCEAEWGWITKIFDLWAGDLGQCRQPSSAGATKTIFIYTSAQHRLTQKLFNAKATWRRQVGGWICLELDSTFNRWVDAWARISTELYTASALCVCGQA